MAEEEDKSSKTEEPSERKLQKAREKGNVPKSKEVNSFFILLAMALVVAFTMPVMMSNILDLYGGIISDIGQTRMDNETSIGEMMFFISERSIMNMVPTFVILAVFAYFGGFVQTGALWSAEPIKPKLSKISIIKGFGRIFSMRSLAEFFKSIAKMVVIGAAIYLILYLNRDAFILLNDQTIMDMVILVQKITLQILAAVLVIAFLLSVIDFIFQKSQFTIEQRMTRREIKDEFKESEGDPHIKGRQRQIRMERAKARMMQEIPKADVVITNPTHYSIVLRYDKETEAAPRLVAKGVDHLAIRIREIAKEHDIPFYEDPPLARQLYADVELNEEIPLELYEAVAQVVAYIYKTGKGKKR